MARKVEEICVNKMKVLVIDPEACTGCEICELVCSLGKTGACRPSLSRIKVVRIENEGVHVPIVCMQCEDAPCKVACPVNAIERDSKTGAMIVDESICIGCRACTIVCPYGAISIDPKSRKAQTCDLCGGDPLCAKWCPSAALMFTNEVSADMLKRRAVGERVAQLILKSRSQ
jgi:carbon-monoxide dehydrogenase iron sulfur subunit